MKKIAHKPLKFYYIVLGILIFGLVMVYNASLLYSQRLFGDPLYFARLQLLWTLAGLVVFVVISFLDVNLLKRVSKTLFIISMTLLLILALASVFVPCSKTPVNHDIAFCPCKNGARRWINLNPPPLPQIPLLGTLGFQASDLTKLAFIMYLPILLESKMKTSKHKYGPFVYFFAFSLAISLLILAQPNMSNAGLMMLVAVAVYYISGCSLKPLAVLAPLALSLGIAFILLSPYRRERFLTLVSPGQQSNLNESYQSDQIRIGLGSGGAFGIGVGQSRQKQHYLPEVIGDSIFAIIGEEMGFFGSLVVISGFAFLTLEMIKISSGAVTLYEKMVGTGVFAWVFFQYLINLYATAGLIPFTGMPIPFISYGGSSMVFTLAGLGLISNIYLRQDK